MTPFKDRRRHHHQGDVRLLGRSHILSEVTSVLDGSWRHALGPIMFEGKPGHGKTAMLNAAAHIATNLGLDVVRARCVEGDQVHSDRLLCEIVRGLDDLKPDDQVDQAEDPPSDHDALAGAVLKRLLARPAGSVVIAIDDAQWIDAQSAHWLLEFCRRRAQQHRVHILISLEPRRPGVRATALDRLLLEHNARTFALEPLTLDEVGVVLSHGVGTDLEQRRNERLHHDTGGVPLLVVLTMSEWVKPNADGSLELTPSAARNASIVRWVFTRITSLPDGTYSLLEVVSVLGPGADFRVAAAAASLGITGAATISDHLVDLDILQAGRPLNFAHEIVRASIYADIPVERRSEIHEFAAELLSAKGHTQLAADHLLQTEPRNNAWAARTLTGAALESLASDDHGRAERYAARAVAETVGTPPHQDLSLVLARLAAQARDPAVVEHVDAAVAHHTDVVPVAATALELVDQLWEEPCRTGLLDALARVRDELRAKDAELALRLDVVETLAEGRSLELGTEIVGRTRADERWSTSQSDLLRVGSALAAVEACAVVSGPTFAEVITIIRDNITIETLARCRSRWASTAIARVLTALVRMGAVDDAAPLLAVAHTHASNDGRDMDAVRLAMLRADASTARGRFDQATSMLDQVIGTTAPASPWNHLARIAQSALAALRGQAAALESSEELDIDDFRTLGPLDDWHAVEQSGRLHLMRQQWQSALDDFAQAELLARARGTDNPALTSWRIGRVDALVGLGEETVAGDLATENLALAKTFGAPTPIARGLRALASTLPHDERITPLEEAVRMLDGRSTIVERCCAMIDLGRAYRDLGDTFAARTILREAADVAVRVGAGSLANDAAEELHATGARPRRLQTRGFDALTPAERRVAQLAADGLTNGAIASALYVSMKTVESHLARAYRKLGVRARTELSGLFGVERTPEPNQAGAPDEIRDMSDADAAARTRSESDNGHGDHVHGDHAHGDHAHGVA